MRFIADSPECCQASPVQRPNLNGPLMIPQRFGVVWWAGDRFGYGRCDYDL